MRWIIDPALREEGAAGIAWCRRFLAQYDMSTVDWLRIDRGRDRPRGERVPQGLYGRCWYPVGRGKAHKGSRLSCQVPGPWPHNVYLRLPPVYVTLTRYYGPRPDHVLDEDGSQVFEMGVEDGREYWDVADLPRPKNCPGQGRRGTRAWWKQDGYITVNNLNEAIVWIVGHEAFHFLRRTRQVPGRNTEHEADAAGNAALAAFREEQS
jgi:hypothetical protein